MHRYMIYLENVSYKPKNAQFLLSKAREMFSDKTVIIRDTRVSERFIEYDISIPEDKNIEEITTSLLSIAPLLESEYISDKKLEKDDAIKHARNLFNNEKYWGAHEVLESVWKNSYGNEKALLNALILISAAFVHDQKNESEICISILKRAMMKLERANGYYFGIKMDEIKKRVSEIIKTGNIEHFII
jgi:hypothetical protein